MPTSPNRTTATPDLDLDLELDGYVEAFETAARSRDADLAEFLPPSGHPKYRAVLCELIRADLEFAWERGDCPRLETYQARFPTLFSHPDDLREVAAEEFRLRRTAGEHPDPDEYLERFGIDLFDIASDDSSQTKVVAPFPIDTWPDDRIPHVGDTIPPGFVLEAELGAGTFGRVFLARQADLAERHVAVKLSSKLVHESQILARLQHTNIVPVYSVHRVGRFHALVMPYLGSTTFADLIHTFRQAGDRPASGKAVVSTLVDRAAGTAPASSLKPNSTPHDANTNSVAPDLSRSTLDTLSRFTFVEAVLWIGSQLADGLAHAHDRGILHRDIKPANVLFTDDGRPMLLDFNLAADRTVPTTGDSIGGTIRYMAPEQLAALQTERGEFSVQSDVYALGLILFELLAGRLPFDDPKGTANRVLTQMHADRSRPLDSSRLPKGVSPAVVSILAKCLAPDRGDRYTTAAELREDLLCQLSNRPLKFAAERSIRERVQKWGRRHPRLSSSVTIGIVAASVLAATVSVFVVRQQRLETFEAERARDDLHSAIGLVYAANGPTAETQDMRATVVAALAPYHIEDEGWTTSPLLRRLTDTDRVAVQQDMAVILALTTQLTEKLAQDEADPKQRDRFQSEASTWRERANRVVTGSNGNPAVAAWDGRHLVEKAAQLRHDARDGEPRFATWMTLGIIETKLNRPAAAAEAFTSAMSLNPRLPWPHFHRGVARLEAKQYLAAKTDFDRYLELRADDPDGYFNRGIARLELTDPRGATADLDVAERLGLKPNRLYNLRSRAKRQQGDIAGADRDQKTAFEVLPTDPQSWAVRGELKLAARDAKGALADFDEALKMNPDFLPALRDKASVLSESLSRSTDAVATLDRILELVPDSLDDRAGRAVLLARHGRKVDARQDAEVCAKSDNPLTLYQAACAFLLAADGPNDKARGLALLRKALRKDQAWAKLMPTDPDLKSVFSDPAFREMVAAAGVLTRDK